ncbi:MAG: TetR/AcrR family transcriptional regulator [Bacteroidota bacterium]
MKHSEVKDKIIDTASELFYRKGYNSTGINEIIAEAGIAKATLYNHFKSKDEICIAYLQSMNSTFLRDIAAFCRGREKGKEQILAIFDFLQEFYQTSVFNGCWCIKTVAEVPKDNEGIRGEIKRQKNLFIQVIADLIGENLGTEEQHTSKVRQIYLLYEGAVSESHLHQADWPIAEAKRICEAVI